MTCRLLLACIYLIVQAESRGWADDRQKLGLALTMPDSSDPSHASSLAQADSTEQHRQSLWQKLTDHLNSVEQIIAHVQMKRYTRGVGSDRKFNGTIDADVSVSEHSEKYSHLVVANADRSSIKTYETLEKVPPPWSSYEFTDPMLIAREEIIHAEGAPVADLIDDEPLLMLERKVPRSHRKFFFLICGRKVFPDYTLRVWFSANSGNLRRVLFLIKPSTTARLLFGIDNVVWDVRFHDVVIDNVISTVPLRSSWETYYFTGGMRCTEQEFSNFRHIDVARDLHSELIYH